MKFEEQVAKLCNDKYNSLGKSGKPRENEWTVLSGVVLQDSTNQLSVVSLCTGTKCLSGSELLNDSLWKKGSRLSDSHAEILARRAFLRYLYHQMNLVQKSLKSEVFEISDAGAIRLLDNTKFHFFSSQTPCGDCSIIPKTTNDFADERPCKVAKVDVNVETEVNDVYRTGAKCLITEEKRDSYEPGEKYHVVGPLRTKPGRGDRTLSLSCSDKIAKWILTGVQGSLLSMLIPEIHFDTIIIGGACPFSMKSMKRGLYERFNHDYKYPVILKANVSFSCMKSDKRNQPCTSSIIWCNVPNRNIEIAVEGRKQGATKKIKKGSYLSISRLALLKSFYDVFEQSKFFENHRHPKRITYYHCKQASTRYQEKWTNIKRSILKTWPKKPQELQHFTL